MKNKLSKKAQRLLFDFKQDAGRAYWESDQGSPESSANAERNLEVSKAAIEKYILSLEKKKQ